MKVFFARPDFRFRVASLFAALVLGLLAALLGISITGALLNKPDLAQGPGDFLVRAYGILSFAIPLYLLIAAVILADPHFRPDRIFILTGTTFPFLTLAIGFAFLRDFNVRSLEWDFLAKTGRIGFSLIIILMTVIESFLIMALTSLFFPGPEAIKYEQKPKKPPEKPPRPLSLPEPIPAEQEYQPDPESDLPSIDKIGLDPFFESGDFEDDIGSDESDIDDDADESDIEAGESDDDNEADDEAEFDDIPPGIVPGAVSGAEDESELPYTQPKGKAPKAKRRGAYKVPVEGILNQYPDGQYWIIDDATRAAAVTLKGTLEEFKIQAEVTGISKGPVITMFDILPAPGVKLSKIVNLGDNIALRLAASSIRIVAPIPGKHAVGIEVPNAKRNIVSLREIIEGELRREKDHEGKKMEIPVILGKDISGEAQTVDLVQMPHLLIAGATGSGKSVCVNAMILSILYQRSPADCRLILIDPKIVELKLYNDIPHLLTPVITEPKKAFQALQYCIYEMERRYACLDSMGVRDIRSYNRRIKERNMAAEHMPYIVVVIDEFADLMATTGKELENTVARLAAMSRAVGIHLVLATQRPSIDVITGLIKANIPSRIAFMVASKMDSRIIIDLVGAEKLLGKGDMLYAGVVDPFPIRIQGAFVSEEEVERVVDYVKGLGEPDYIDDEIFIDDEDDDLGPSLFDSGDDPLYEKALEIVMQQQKASASYIQRRLKIGYNRAARLVELMEHNGVVGPAQGSKPRELLRNPSL
ncbi:DNA translocase FtsK [Treponema primitia]|uniref:DNA translocase FtsK n=1 Tax=Treponema primitia TaxID=88058 RepID=UPI00025552C6|nr:DNA translocase FtsK [Treponema primitia]